ILFIIFSPIGKPFLFGYPSVQSATKQFLNPSQSFNETIYAPVEALSKEFASHNSNNGDFFGSTIMLKRNSSVVENSH
ncbi:hypothetical protein Goshw_005236, partial [Gossypium schwendimanii]|nr:hypothetical protein [Gossypium schwendimanii]